MQRVEPIEHLEPVRRRPAMYIGATTPAHLVRAIAMNVAIGIPAPRAIRVHLFADNAVSIAFDGEPLPIAPVGEVPHPELYSLFLYMTHPERPLAFGGCIANALSTRLVVSTMHHGARYRAAFSRGGLVSLLSCVACDEPLGTNWLTFEPDATIVSGALTFEALQAMVRRIAGDVAISTHDRRGEQAEWC